MKKIMFFLSALVLMSGSIWANVTDSSENTAPTTANEEVSSEINVKGVEAWLDGKTVHLNNRNDYGVTVSWSIRGIDSEGDFHDVASGRTYVKAKEYCKTQAFSGNYPYTMVFKVISVN